MFHWGAFTLFLYMVMRMSGFVLFSPIFGRSGMPAMFQAGFIFTLAGLVYSVYGGTAPIPDTLLELSLRLLLEMGLGLILSIVMRFFFYIADQAGEIVDTQMGMSMARTYDASSQASMTTTANLLSNLMLMLFFLENGHLTLLRLFLTSGEIVPFGTTALGTAAAERGVELFAQCALLSLKLSLPVLAAELLGQIGMGILMKAIPQINVFSINIELKVLIGLVMLLLLFSPMSNFLLEAESAMLIELRQLLEIMGR